MRCRVCSDRRIHDDVLPANKRAVAQVQEVCSQFAAIPEEDIASLSQS